ncbi:MAG: undecaprenyl/decaprenyl-phosphate alpha-N-acetylglucosaminyl 1-phosphate transferase [Tidjanibacter sp.]|nr:undecaprenyl/decaprenyl-phosphate alpha-N-acetylglucosaminyl 1-phosphate transferase [Tidjanibacter sp.]
MSLCMIIVPALAAFIATIWFQPHVLRIAKEKNIVDNPNARKLQRVPIPMMGGVAVVFGLLVGMITFSLFGDFDDMLAVLVCMTIMMFVGMIDDIIGLSFKTRFFVEILLVSALIVSTGNQINNFHGLWGITIVPDWVSVPLTIFACVGIINAVNLIDGVDGYSSGYCVMACLYFGYVFWKLGDVHMVVLSAITIGSLLPFFFCNVFGKHSKMFIGDAGTLSMGILMSTFVMNMLTATTDSTAVADNLGLIPLSLAIMSVPIFDTLRVMGSRILRGTSPFKPDKTHLHHAFIDLGFSHIGTTFSILCLNSFVVLCWFIAYKLGVSVDVQLYIVIALGTIIAFVFYWFVQYNIRKNTRIFRVLKIVGRATHLERKGIWEVLQKWLDRKSTPKEEKENVA